jgi:carboxymethylenebutenolidase
VPRDLASVTLPAARKFTHPEFENVVERRIEATVEDGVAEALLFTPDRGDSWPLVVFYMDAFGLRPALTGMAEHLVDAGYAVLQPNLYWRSGSFAPFEPSKTFGDPAERERLMKLMQAVDVTHVASDTVALVARAAEDKRIKSELFACLGYCMGGRLAFGVAAELPSRVVASASIHPGGLVTDQPDSPHTKSSRIKAAVYLGIADEDRGCTPEHQQALEEALTEAGVRHTLELYEGARHGFAVPDHSVYVPAAAERHWDRVLELFGTQLKA